MNSDDSLGSMALNFESIALVVILLISVSAGLYLTGSAEDTHEIPEIDNSTPVQEIPEIDNLTPVQDTEEAEQTDTEKVNFSEKEVSFKKLQDYHKEFDQKLYGFNAANNETLRVKGPFIVNSSTYFIAEDPESNATRTFRLEQENYTEIRDHSIERKVKGLKNLYLETRNDPLFYSSYSQDLDFSEYHDLKKKVFGPLFQHLKLVRERNLYPQRFWGNLTLTIDKTDSFYDTTSRENAIELFDQYERTARAYDRGVVNFIHYVNESDFDNMSVTFVNGGETTPQLLKKNIRKMSNNSRMLLEETERRREILQGRESPQEFFLKEEVNYTEVSFERATLSDTEIRQSFHDQENMSYYFLNEAEVEGPYRVDMACIGEKRQLTRLEHKDAEDRYPLYHIADGNYRMTRYEMKDNFTYRGDRQIIYNGTGQIGYLGGKDIAMLNCNCPYNNLVAVDWQLIDKVVEKLGEKPLYHGLNQTEIEDERLRKSVVRGQKIERNLMQNPSTEGVEALGRNLQQTRAILYRRTEEGESINPELLERTEYMWRMRILIDSKLPMMKYPLDNYYNSADQFRRGLYGAENRVEKAFTPPPGMLLDYSHYSLTFGSFSETVWRNGEEPQYWKPLLINNFPERYLEELDQSQSLKKS